MKKDKKVFYIPIIAVLFVMGYKMLFAESYAGNDSNPSQKESSVISWLSGGSSYDTKIKEYVEFMNYTTNTNENFKDWNMSWSTYNARTPVVMIDFENMARVNGCTVSEAEQVVRNNIHLFGKYLQMFNNKVHDGKAKEGELTLVVVNRKGQEVTMTQVMAPVSLTE